jgi:hypothetical protein
MSKLFEHKDRFELNNGSILITVLIVVCMIPVAESIEYVSWNDPLENAFSLEVPSTWAISGGLYRYASADLRIAIQAVSSDGKIIVSIGDSRIPNFVVPNLILQSIGFKEDSWYSPGQGVNLLVKPYMTGKQYAELYVLSEVASLCSKLDIIAKNDLIDTSNEMNSIYSNYGMKTSWNFGEVAFSCNASGELIKGYYYVGTKLTSWANSDLWRPEYLGGYFAPESAEAEAREVLQHMLSTNQANPEWLKQQGQKVDQAIAIQKKENEQFDKMIQNYVSTI